MKNSRILFIISMVVALICVFGYVQQTNNHGSNIFRYPVQSLSFSPDGQMLAVAYKDGVVMVWDTKSWESRLSVPPADKQSSEDMDKGEALNQAIFISSTTLLLQYTGSRDKIGPRLILMDVTSGKSINEYIFNASVGWLIYSAAASTIFYNETNLIVGEGSVRGLHLKNNQFYEVNISYPISKFYSVALSKDGSYLLALLAPPQWENTIAKLPLNGSVAGKIIEQVYNCSQAISEEGRKIVLSPDGRYTAIGGALWGDWNDGDGPVESTGVIHVLDMANLNCTYRVTDSLPVLDMLFLPRKHMLAYSTGFCLERPCESDSELKLLSMFNGDLEYLLEHNQDVKWIIAASPDENLLATGSDNGHVTVWSLASGKSIKLKTL